MFAVALWLCFMRISKDCVQLSPVKVVSNMFVVCGLVKCFSVMLLHVRFIISFSGLEYNSEILRGVVTMWLCFIWVEKDSEMSTIFSSISMVVV